MKIAKLDKIDNYDVIVTSYMGCLYSFWYEQKDETHKYTMLPNTYS